MNASIGGVAFHVQGHTTTVGRKVAIYRLPFDSKGVVSRDMGRAPRKFQIRAVLLQNDITQQQYDEATFRFHRQQLLDVLESEGPKLLVHPVYGRVNVVIEDNVSITETTEDGGKISIDFECWEHREFAKSGVATRPDTKSNVINKAQALREVAGDSFESRFSIDVPDFVSASNLAVLDTIIAELTKVNAVIGSALAVPAHYASQLTRIAEQTATLIGTPTLLYNTVDATIAQVVAAINLVAGRNRRGIGSLQEVTVSMSALGFDTAEPADIDTPSRDLERANRAALLVAMRASGLGSVAEAAAEAEYDSSDEALEILTTLVDALGNLSDNTITGIEPDAETYDAIRDLISALTDHLKSVAGALPELTTYTPAEAMPALVLAYQLYGDATRADEILERNPHIVNPNLVPAGEPLEILAP